MKSFPNYRQPDRKDCGPTSLKIVAKHYGRQVSIAATRKWTHTTRTGSSLLNLCDAAEHMGFKAMGVRVSFRHLMQEIALPCIVHWKEDHYVVVYKVRENKVYLSDPAVGLLTLDKESFLNGWMGNNAHAESQEGVALLLEPTLRFYQNEWEEEKTYDFSFLYRYLFRYKGLLFQLTLGLAAGSLVQLIFPLLTQSIVDVGIQNQDLGFIGHKGS